MDHLTSPRNWVSCTSFRGRATQFVQRLHTEAVRKRRWRAACLVILLLFYGLSLAFVNGPERLSSASWREILGELFPDAAKSAKRLTEGEVVPAFAEALHADDVTKHLNWFQTFCRQKFGMDDHIEFFWRCSLVKVAVEAPDTVVALDPHMNCSKPFIQRHIIEGDDLRCAPYGEGGLKAVQEEFKYESDVAKIDPGFDEYTVLDHSPLFGPIFEGLQELEDAVKNLGGDKRLLSGTHLKTRSGTLRKKAPHRNALGQGQNIMLMTEIEKQEKQEAWCKDFSKCPWNEKTLPHDLPCYCFHGKTPEDKKSHVSSTCRNHHFGLVHLCQPSTITALWSIQHVEGRSKIRHWSDHTGKPTKRRRLNYFLVQMNFESQGAGWYSVSLFLKSAAFSGRKTLINGMCVIIFLVLICYLILGHFFFFLVNLPCRIRAIWALRDERVLQGQLQERPELCATEVFESRLLLLVDPRGTLSTFMNFPGICIELVAGASFMVGVVMSCTNNVEFVKLDGLTKKRTTIEYIVKHSEGIYLVIELLYDLILDAIIWHAVAWLALYFHAFFLSIKDVVRLKWIESTILLACENLLYFVIFYLSIIFGFGTVMWIQLGSHFVQFSTLSRVNMELILLTLGFPSQAFDDIHPFQDNKSFIASLYLGCFLLVAVTISLNLFTTILVDAYRLAMDPEGPEKNLMEFHQQKIISLMAAFGIAQGRNPDDNGQTIEMASSSRKTLRLTLSRNPHRLTHSSRHDDPPEDPS